MFCDASSFNGDVSQFNTSNVTDMSGMFCDAISFNGDLSSWDVRKVQDMSEMTHGAVKYTGDIPIPSNSSKTIIGSMFHKTTQSEEKNNRKDVSGSGGQSKKDCVIS